ncbi:tubulin-folding cofactor B [Amanita muscaria]
MSSIVKVFVVSPDTRSERRYDLHTTVEQLKNKLEPVTGIPATNQIISILESESASRAIAVLNDDTKQLGFYGLKDWQVLQVADSNPSLSLTGQLGDVSQVQKFELSDAEYEKRADTVLTYKKIHKVGRFAPEDKNQDAEQHIFLADTQVGARCEVESSEEGLHKRGTIRYVGETKFSKGVWVGVEYDEPMGKNDGSVQGEKYFVCRPNYGVFVRHDKVRIGDFPVEELDLEDEEM